MPVFSFLLCNLGICLIIGMILAVRHILETSFPAEPSIISGFCFWAFWLVPFCRLGSPGWPLLLSRLNAARLPSPSGMGRRLRQRPGWQRPSPGNGSMISASPRRAKLPAFLRFCSWPSGCAASWCPCFLRQHRAYACTGQASCPAPGKSHGEKPVPPMS